MSDWQKLDIIDGSLIWDPAFLSPAESLGLQQILQTKVSWKQEPIKIFGKEVMQPRLTAWYADPGISYSYSGIQMKPLDWFPALADLREKIENLTQSRFNSVLLNYYRHGQDSMGWHSDNEPELGKNPVIASLSLGETRRFHLKHRKRKDIEPIRLDLNDGSLVLMSGPIQHNWLHQISKTKRQVGARLNLTFRYVYPGYQS